MFAPGKPCVLQSLGTGWPGMLWSLQSPWLLRSCPLPVLFMAQAAASLGCFQRVGSDALCSKGLTAQGQGIAEGMGGSRASRVQVTLTCLWQKWRALKRHRAMTL